MFSFTPIWFKFIFLNGHRKTEIKKFRLPGLKLGMNMDLYGVTFLMLFFFIREVSKLSIEETWFAKDISKLILHHYTFIIEASKKEVKIITHPLNLYINCVLEGCFQRHYCINPDFDEQK